MNTNEFIISKDGFSYKCDKNTVAEDDEYVHCPDTSLCIGFVFGKIKKVHRETSFNRAGFKFYKIIESDNPELNLPHIS